MKTDYASPERAEQQIILQDNIKLSSDNLITTITDATNTLFMILNEHRQIVFANKKLLSLLHCDIDSILGKRPGELLKCIHSNITEGGCGTTVFCRECGAVNAILKALNGKTVEEECRISSIIDGKYTSFDLLVNAKPADFENSKYILFSVIDISDKKRKEVLERTFFHDLLNTAGGVFGFAGILKDSVNPESEIFETAETIYDISDKLIREIKSQRELLAAENNTLEISVSIIELNDYIKSLIKIITKNNDIAKRNIVFDEPEEKIVFFSDEIILQRILINMIKNAAEASESTDTVTVKVYKSDDKLVFSVHNPSYIEMKVQLQIFQRSFSTKGRNRGIGTYSMKLFGENYLKGKVWFESSQDKGTTFYLKIPVKT